MNMMNMNMNMLGGFGMTGLGMNGFGGGLFTNCFGDFEYDKMAGFAVANSLFSVGVQAFQSIRSQKEPKVDYKEEKNDIDEKINKQLEKLPGATEDDYYAYQVESKYDDAISTANTNIENAKKSIASYEETINTLGAKKESEMTAAEKSKFDEAKKQKAELEKSIAEGGELYEALKEAEEAKAKRQDEINEIISNIDKLLDEKDKIQNSMDMQTLKDADGNRLTRARKECMTENYDEKNPASKADIRRAFNEFIKAKDNNSKKAAADKILEMYDSNPKLEDKYSKEIKIIENWIEENP